MTALYLSPIYVLVNAYIIWRMVNWLSVSRHVFHHKAVWMSAVVVYIVAALSILIGFLLPDGPMQRAFRLIGNYWLGVQLFTVLIMLIFEIIGILWRKFSKDRDNERIKIRNFRWMSLICVLLIAGLSVYSSVSARIIHTTQYEITIDKQVTGLDSLDIVLVADLHMGYNVGSETIQQMVDKINACEPDIVLIAGDIFDNQYKALDSPQHLKNIFKQINSKYGVYACYGNHDIEEKILAGFTFGSKQPKVNSEEMNQFLKDCDIKLLKDEGVLVDGLFYVYGRPDYSKPGTVRTANTRLTPSEITADMDLSKPVIVIDHQPKELEELAAAGVDIDLCGHTHDGQLFPSNYLVKLMWPNSCGYKKFGNMNNIVTSGVGVFGPYMRLGTKSEICNIKVNFEDLE